MNFLKIKQNNQDASFQDIKLLEDLSYVSKLNPEVINVLIDYVMLKQDNKLPYNYVMKIANSLANAGVKTAEEAMEYFYKIRDKYNTRVSSSNASEVNIPSKVTPVTKTVVEKEESYESSHIDEAMELERLKAERRKRKKQNAIEDN